MVKKTTVKTKTEEKGEVEKKGKVEPTTEEKKPKVFLNKYLKNKKYNNMQIAAVGANLKSKIEQNTIEEWDKIFANILNKRLK